MALAQLSPTSVTVNPAHLNPQVRTDQSATTVQANQTAETTIKKTRTDTVAISRQAAQMAAQAQNTAEQTRERQTEQPKRKLDVRA